MFLLTFVWYRPHIDHTQRYHNKHKIRPGPLSIVRVTLSPDPEKVSGLTAFKSPIEILDVFKSLGQNGRAE